MSRRTLLASAVAAASLTGVLPVFAQQRGFAIDRFEPSERGSDWFAGESLDLRGNMRPAVGVVVDYANRPLAVYDASGSVKTSVVRDQLLLHAGGSLVLGDRVRVALNLPVAAYQSGTDGVSRGVTYAAPVSPALGDLRLGADLRLLGEYGEPLTVAAGVQVLLPTGNRDAYTSDGTVRVVPRLLAAGEIGQFVYAARVSFDYRSLNGAFAGSSLGSQMLFGASAGARLGGTFVVGPEVYGATVVGGDDPPFKVRNTPVELLFSGHATFASDWRVGAGAGPGLTRGYGEPALRVLASLEWAPGAPPKDADQDGVPDGEDACPTTRGIRTNDPKTNGCPPPPPSDRDHDGVADTADACPDVPGVLTGDPKTNGCPPDRDKDGILDAADACPDVPGVATDDPKTNGCPSDRDKDSVYDTDDACPDVAGVKTADPKTNGCPGDRDKDGIADNVDACPDEPGKADPDPKKNGCPLAFVQARQIVITQQVKFRFDSADLDPAGDPILEAVLALLKDHPELKKVRVEGHTDNKGTVDYNKRLSGARAASVVTWLKKHGVAAARLTSEGVGFARPLVQGDSEDAGRANRRVEFHIVDGPDAVTPSAPSP